MGHQRSLCHRSDGAEHLLRNLHGGWDVSKSVLQMARKHACHLQNALTYIPSTMQVSKQMFGAVRSMAKRPLMARAFTTQGRGNQSAEHEASLKYEHKGAEAAKTGISQNYPNAAGSTRPLEKGPTDNPLGLKEDTHVPGYVNTSRSHNPSHTNTAQGGHHHNTQHYTNESTRVDDHLREIRQHADEVESHKGHHGTSASHSTGSTSHSSGGQKGTSSHSDNRGSSSQK
eukprot:TRINITY_DN5808_c0_g1_i1.p1 TRINITY_DN5808_c0_g1~~TRINITY_DN5808_c0_g1_i1.p1  ORF type:complete len:229 (-),score=19.89 TRINITY_DN5808_c0_g1_i1:49-735(-)